MEKDNFSAKKEPANKMEGKMLKETIISIVIVVSIVVLDFATQDYTKQSTEETISKLTEIKNSIKEKNIEAITKENIENNMEKNNEEKSEEDSEIKELVDEVFEIWEKRYDKLAYFIEHDELEKVETNLTNVKSYFNLKNFDMAISSIEETAFVLEHIKDRNAFNLENIF